MPNNTEQMIKELDSKRMQAMVDGDVDTLDALLADDLTYVHTSAVMDTKQSIIGAIRTGALNYRKMSPRNVSVRSCGDTALVNGEADVEVTSHGNHLTFSLRFTDVYVNHNGDWRMVAWQSTRLPEA